MPTNTIDVGVRPYQSSDLPDILTIEQLSSPAPWSKRDFDRCIRRRNISTLVVLANTRVVGFVILEKFKEFFQILNFAIHPDFRRRSIGTKLVGYLIDKLGSIKLDRICIELRESNLDAQLFLQKCKFRATEVMRGYYQDTGEDCYKLEYRNRWPSKLTSSDTKGAFVKDSKQDL